MRFTAQRDLKPGPVLVQILVRSLVLLCLPGTVLSFSRGASGSSCTRMVPGHVHAHPHDPALSHVTLHTSSTHYLPGHLLTVTVRSSRDFMGFLLQARSAERPGPQNLVQSSGSGMGPILVGGAWTLTPPRTHTIRCVSDGDTVTHSDKQLKRNLSFVWRAPDRPAGDVRFYLTVVQSYFVYWTGIRSPVLHDGTRSRWRGNFHSMLQVQTSDEGSRLDQENETANITASTFPPSTNRDTTSYKRLATPSRLRTQKAPTSALTGVTVSTVSDKAEVKYVNGNNEGGIGVFRRPETLVHDKSIETKLENAESYRLAPEFSVMNERTKVSNRTKDSKANMILMSNATESSFLMDMLQKDAAISETPQTASIKSQLGTSLQKTNGILDEMSRKMVTEGFQRLEISEQPKRSVFSSRPKPEFGESTDKGNTVLTQDTSAAAISQSYSSTTVDTSQVTLDSVSLYYEISKPKDIVINTSGSIIGPSKAKFEMLLHNLKTNSPALSNVTPTSHSQNQTFVNHFERPYFGPKTQSWTETNQSTKNKPQTEQASPEKLLMTSTPSKFSPFQSIKDLLLHLDSLLAEDTSTFPPFVPKTTQSIATRSTHSSYSMVASDVQTSSQGKYLKNLTSIDSSNFAKTNSNPKNTWVFKSSTMYDPLGDVAHALLPTSDPTQAANSHPNSDVTSTSISPTSKIQTVAPINSISSKFSTVLPPNLNQRTRNYMKDASKWGTGSPSTSQFFYSLKLQDKVNPKVSKGSTIIPTTRRPNYFRTTEEGPTSNFPNRSNIFHSIFTHRPRSSLQNTSAAQNSSTNLNYEGQHISQGITKFPTGVTTNHSTFGLNSNTSQLQNKASTNFPHESINSTKFLKILAKQTKDSTIFSPSSSQRSVTPLQETTKSPLWASVFSPTNYYDTSTISDYVTPTSLPIQPNSTAHKKSTSERDTTQEHPRHTTLSMEFSPVLASNYAQKATTVSKDDKNAPKNLKLTDNSTNFPFDSRSSNVPFRTSIKPKRQSINSPHGQPKDVNIVPTLSKDYASTTSRDDLDLVSKSFQFDFSNSKSKLTTWTTAKSSPIVQPPSIGNMESKKSDFQQKETLLASEVTAHSHSLSNHHFGNLQQRTTLKVSAEAPTINSFNSHIEHVLGLHPRGTIRIHTKKEVTSSTASASNREIATTFQDINLSPLRGTLFPKSPTFTDDDPIKIQGETNLHLQNYKTFDSTNTSPVKKTKKGFGATQSSNLNHYFSNTIEYTSITSNNLASKASIGRSITGTSTHVSKSSMETNSRANTATNFFQETSKESAVTPSTSQDTSLSSSLNKGLKQAPKGIPIDQTQHNSSTNNPKNSWQPLSHEHANISTLPSTFPSSTSPHVSDTNKFTIGSLLDYLPTIKAAASSEQKQTLQGAISPVSESSFVFNTTRDDEVNDQRNVQDFSTAATSSNPNTLLESTTQSFSQNTKQSSFQSSVKPNARFENKISERPVNKKSDQKYYGFWSTSSNGRPSSRLLTSSPLKSGSSTEDVDNATPRSPFVHSQQSTTNYFLLTSNTRPSLSMASKSMTIGDPESPKTIDGSTKINQMSTMGDGLNTSRHQSPTEKLFFSSSIGRRQYNASKTTTNLKTSPMHTSQKNFLQTSTMSSFSPSNTQPTLSTVSFRQRSKVGSRSSDLPRSNQGPLKGDEIGLTFQSMKPKTNLRSNPNNPNFEHKPTTSQRGTFLSSSFVNIADPKLTNGYQMPTAVPMNPSFVTALSNTQQKQISTLGCSTIATSSLKSAPRVTTKDINRFSNLSNTAQSFLSILQKKTMTIANFPMLPTQSPLSGPPNVFFAAKTTAKTISTTSTLINLRPSAARRSFINHVTTFATTSAQNTQIDIALPNHDAKENSAISRISQDTDRNVEPKVEVKAKLPPFPDPDREGKYPDIIPRHSAWELGMLLGCAAGLGMVLVLGVRYVYRETCGKRTQVTLHDREREYSRGERGLIHVQECGDLVRVRRIRENSFVLLAEYDILATPGD